MTSPAGTVGYEYDGQDRLVALLGQNGRTELEWEPGGQRLLSIQGGGVVERRCFDAVGRLASVTSATSDPGCGPLSTPVLSRHEYTYDERGNRLSEGYLAEGLNLPEVTRYGYDRADRLVGVSRPDGTAVLYGLRADGTRVGEKLLEGYVGDLGGYPTAAGAQRHWSYAHDGAGGLAGIWDERDPANRTQVAQLTTDPAGRLLSETWSGVQRQYGWDVAGRLVSMSETVSGVSTSARYGYDWANLRRWKQLGSGETTEYLWANGELIEERLPGGPVLYEHGAGIVTAIGAERILHDGLGSAVGRVDVLTGSSTPYRYDAWGGLLDGTGPNGSDPSLAYAGQHWDPDAGLSYAQQRWYDPRLGRFLSEDPLFGRMDSPTSLHPFAYANGNSTRYTDSAGEEAVVISGQPGPHGNRLHFLINGLDRAKRAMKKIVESGSGEGVTWIVYSDATGPHDPKQLEEMTMQAHDAGISVIVTSSSDEITKYINEKCGGLSRLEDPVMQLWYVGHAITGRLAIGYNNESIEHGERLKIEELDSSAFGRGVYIDLLGGCRTAVPDDFLVSRGCAPCVEGLGGWLDGRSVVEQISEKVGDEGIVRGSNVRVNYFGDVMSEKNLLKKKKGSGMAIEVRGPVCLDVMDESD